MTKPDASQMATSPRGGRRAALQALWPAIKYVLAAFFGGALALAGQLGLNYLLIGPENARISYTEDWEVFDLLYFVGDKLPAGQMAGDLRPIGVEPLYRHIIRLENSGNKPASRVRVEIANASQTHEISVEPKSLNAEVFRVEAEPAVRHIPGDQQSLLQLPTLPPKSAAVVRVTTQLQGPTVRFTYVERVVADDAPPGVAATQVDRSVKSREVNDLAAKAFGMASAPDWSVWKTAEIKSTVELHPK